MINKDLIEQVTSLVDNEIKNKKEVDRIKLLLEENEYLKVEYEAQALVKNSLRTRLGSTAAPEYLKNKITAGIRKETVTIPKKKYPGLERFSFLLKPQYALPIIALFILVYLFFPRPTKDFAEIIKNQEGNSNMFVLAKNNFKSIVNGELIPQLVSNDSNIIKKFFHEKGVKYQTFVPQFDDLELVGGVISEYSGKKFAHHFYKCKNGKLIYMFQAPEESIKTDKTLHLSDDLIKWVENGKKGCCLLENISILVWKHEKNYIVVLSNEDMNMIRARFLAEK